MKQSLTKAIRPRDGQTKSIWQFSSKAPVWHLAQLPSHMIFDVLIVGAGITGISTALLLQKQGKKCLIAEANNMGFGTTGGTTAHINTFFDTSYPQIEKNFSKSTAAQVAQAGKEALNFIKNTVDHYQIDCDFETKKAYIFSQTDQETKELNKILISSRKAGLSIEEASNNEVPIHFKNALCVKDQAQFHPLKYILALAEEFKKLGGIIIENTLIQESTYQENLHRVKTGKHVIKAKNIVYATHIPPGINLLSFRCAPYRSYVLALKLKDQNYPDGLVYDMKAPYHYFRTHLIKNEKYLILGGEDHKTGHQDPEKAFNNLEEYARHYFNVSAISYKWSAQYYTSADGLPYIGKMPGAETKVYIATGFNGNGITFGTLSALIISDFILKKPNKYAHLFEPSRIKPLAGFAEFMKENTDVAYHFIADRFSLEDLNSLKEMKRGEGKVVNFEHNKVAIYKDDNGLISALNPVCSHAKCIVTFNKVEKSWDCPCHGARYDVNGKVLTGPAKHHLTKIDLSK